MKTVTPEEAVSRVKDGDVVLVGGFGLAGSAHTLIAALADASSARDLTIVSNNCGPQGLGLGRLLLSGRVRRVVGSYFTGNPDVARLHGEGSLEVVVRPQGTLSEAIRAGGAGIPAFFTPTGAGTELAQGKETRLFNGRAHVLEEAITGDVALIRAFRSDERGNLIYTKAARNFGPMMATAARFVAVEVDEVVKDGSIDPETVVTPHLYVDVTVLCRTRVAV